MTPPVPDDTAMRSAPRRRPLGNISGRTRTTPTVLAETRGVIETNRADR